ncbi:MAG: GNAT family N-acetyltransferase [Patescibacteria group bacterium]|jgi:ribosomal protein S18 acetylase RimI-like enzyme
MRIRKATIKELETIQQLNLDHFNYEIELFDETLNNKWTFSKKGANYFIKKINNEKSVVLIAEEDNKIIGILVGEIPPKDFSRKPRIILAEMKQLFLDKNYRSKGIGSALVDEFFKWAKKQKATRAQVCASVTNIDGVRFYKKHGFEDFNLFLEKEL